MRQALRGVGNPYSKNTLGAHLQLFDHSGLISTPSGQQQTLGGFWGRVAVSARKIDWLGGERAEGGGVVEDAVRCNK